MSNSEGFVSGFDVAVAFRAGDHLSSRRLGGVDHFVAHRTDHRDGPGAGGRLRLERGHDECTLTMRAFALLAGVNPGHAKTPAATLAAELDLVGLFGHDAGHAALGTRERPPREWVRNAEFLAAHFAGKLNHSKHYLVTCGLETISKR